MTLKEKQAWINDILDSSDRAVERALMAVYNRQTADEKAALTTTHLNGMGFNGLDAEFGCSLAEKLKKYGSLTKNQIFHARKMLKRYWRQLAEVAEANGKLPSIKPEKPAPVAAVPVTKGNRTYSFALKNEDKQQYTVMGGSKIYVVTLAPSWNGARCSCPAAVFQKVSPCKHETLVRESLQSVAKPVEFKAMLPKIEEKAKEIENQAKLDQLEKEMNEMVAANEKATEEKAFMSDPDMAAMGF